MKTIFKIYFLLGTMLVMSVADISAQRTRPDIDQMELSPQDTMMILTLPEGIYTGVQNYVTIDFIRGLIDTSIPDTDLRLTNPRMIGNVLTFDILNVITATIIGTESVDLSQFVDEGSFDTRVDTAYMSGDNLVLDVYNINNSTLVKSLIVDLSQFNDTIDSLTADHDWYTQGTTDEPNSINDPIWTLNNVEIGNGANSSDLEIFHAGNSVLEQRPGLSIISGNNQGIGLMLQNTFETWHINNSPAADLYFQYRTTGGSEATPLILRNDDGMTTGAITVKATEIQLPDYPNTRDDKLTDPPINFLYTDATGNVRSAPASIIGAGEWSIEYFDNVSGNALTISATCPVNAAHIVVEYNGVDIYQAGTRDYTCTAGTSEINFNYALANDRIVVKTRL